MFARSFAVRAADGDGGMRTELAEALELLGELGQRLECHLLLVMLTGPGYISASSSARIVSRVLERHEVWWRHLTREEANLFSAYCERQGLWVSHEDAARAGGEEAFRAWLNEGTGEVKP